MSAQLYRMDSGDQDQETLYNSYTCAYYVQSPSTISHANSTDAKGTANINNLLIDSSTFLHQASPTRSDTTILFNKINPEISRFTLSRYSSSYGSSNSFLNEKKLVGDSVNGSGDELAGHPHHNKGMNRLVIVDGKGIGGYGEEGEEGKEEEEDEENYYGRKGGWWRWWWWRYCSFNRSSSLAWFCLQLFWRFFASLGIALLVFYVVTKPPPPKVSIKVVRIPQFGLAEGVDNTGVTTKVLTCNCSLSLLIDNKSRVFGLHIRPPLLEMSFGHLPFAKSRGPKLYAETHILSSFQLYVGTRDKPMYGAGRSMQDMLDSGKGLPIIINVSMSSNFRVVWDLIKPKFHHQAQCLLVIQKAYDKKHQTQVYTSTCTIS